MSPGRRIVVSCFVVLLFVLPVAGAVDRKQAGIENAPLQPYVLSSDTPASFEQRLIEVRQALEQGGFLLLGEYELDDDSRVLVVIPSEQNGNISQPGDAMAAITRVAVVRLGKRVQVSYTNPEYYSAAFRSQDNGVARRRQLHQLLGSQREFGGGRLGAMELRRYHYSFGMEYFDDMLELRRFRSQTRALRAVSSALERESSLKSLFQYDAKQGAIAVIGVAIMEGEGSDDRRRRDLDAGALSQVAHLPHELILWKGRVLLPHPRYRIPLDFPSARMVGPGNLRYLASYSEAIILKFSKLVESAQP